MQVLGAGLLVVGFIAFGGDGPAAAVFGVLALASGVLLLWIGRRPAVAAAKARDRAAEGER